MNKKLQLNLSFIFYILKLPKIFKMKNIILFFAFIFLFSLNNLNSQDPKEKTKTEKNDSLKSKKKKALLPLKPERKIQLKY